MAYKTIACGGCGATNPEKRCIGCLHDFGDPGSAWVNLREPATALAEAQAEIARLRDALREIIDASNNTGIEMGTVGMRVAELVEDIARAALTNKPDAGDGE